MLSAPVYQPIPSSPHSLAAKPSSKKLLSLVALIGALSLLSLVGSVAFRAEKGEVALVNKAENAVRSAVSRLEVFEEAGESCKTYDDETTIAKDNKLFDSPVGGTTTVAFTFKLDADSGDGNIFSTGDKSDLESAAVFYENGNLNIKLDKKGETCDYVQDVASVALDREYRVEFDLAFTHLEVKLDGDLKFKYDYPSDCDPVPVSSIAIYAGGSWDATAKGKVSEVSVCAKQ